MNLLEVKKLLRTPAVLTLLAVSAFFRAIYTCWAVLPYNDGQLYDRLARGLLTDATFGIPGNWSPKAPGYPYFLAAVYGVFGDHHAVLYAVQHAIDLGTAVLVLAIAVEWNLSRRAALASFAIALFNPFTMFWASCVLSETLSMFLFAVAVWQGVRFTATSFRRYAVFGATMSLLALVRPAFAAVAPAVLLASWAVQRISFVSWFKGAAVAGAAFLLVWAPWGARNMSHYDHVVPYITGDPSPTPGYNTWALTWVTSMLDVYGAFFEDPPQLPPRAYESADEKSVVTALLDERKGLGPKPDPHTDAFVAIDSHFLTLATERRARHPLTHWVINPVKRAATMWFTREITVMAQANVRMDELRSAVRTRPLALATKLALMMLMPLLTLATLIGSVSLFRSGTKSVLVPVGGAVAMTLIIEWLMLFQPTFVIVMEPRYVIEFLPPLTPAAVVGVLAVWGLARRGLDTLRGRLKLAAPAKAAP